MTGIEQSPYGTAHREYSAAQGQGAADGPDWAGRAWDMAAVIEEARARDGDCACYFWLAPEEGAGREALAAYLHELGHDAEISPRKDEHGWLVRVGPSRHRGRSSRRRPRSVERYG